MNENQKKSLERLKDSSSVIEKEINNLIYKFLSKYTLKENIIKKLTQFETSKGLESFKKEIQKLQNSGEIKRKIDIKELFNDLKKLKEEIQGLSQAERQKLKKQLEKSNNFSPSSKYDIGEIVKKRNPQLYQSIINPNGIKQHFISAGFGIGNSVYKTGIGLGKLTIDFIKLLTFQVSIKDIKEQFKRV